MRRGGFFERYPLQQFVIDLFCIAHNFALLLGHGWDVKCVDWHPTNSLIVSGSKDSLVKVRLRHLASCTNGNPYSELVMGRKIETKCSDSSRTQEHSR